jgi:acetylornithine deacetylase/succinyl-diaminopimelate desuccinylase-like protein
MVESLSAPLCCQASELPEQRHNTMTRKRAIDLASACLDNGLFKQHLAQRIQHRSCSQEPDNLPVLHTYLKQILMPALEEMQFACSIMDNPLAGQPPFLIARRIEQDAGYTVLSYGHGDVTRGHDAKWSNGRSPWALSIEGDTWYGRGIADNKGQHTINLLALAQVLQARKGRLGYNITFLFEMGEEVGSPGLREFCELHRSELAAEVFLASDGPRLSIDQPTVFLGSRGGMNFELSVQPRDKSYHSGNWGGLLRNPAIRLSHALAHLVSARGQILVPDLLPDTLPHSVRLALADIKAGTEPGAPAIDPEWGEPGLSPEERVYGWNSLEILAFVAGTPDAPVNAIPGHARAHCQIRFVVGSHSERFLPAMRAHLDQAGFGDVQLEAAGPLLEASRLDPDNPWVGLALNSLAASTGKKPALLPNLGGTLPNDIFSLTLGLPTLWIPHAHPSCGQHAPDEHLKDSTIRESLQIMAGLFWDLGEPIALACLQPV